MKKKIVVAITGASGAIYARLLLDKLQQLNSQVAEVAIVMSDNAKQKIHHIKFVFCINKIKKNYWGQNCFGQCH